MMENLLNVLAKMVAGVSVLTLGAALTLASVNNSIATAIPVPAEIVCTPDTGKSCPTNASGDGCQNSNQCTTSPECYCHENTKVGCQCSRYE